MSLKPFLSIIIPAYNEAHRLPNSLPQIIDYVQSKSFEIEVMIVDNASTDNTSEIVHQFAQSHDFIRLLQLEERGKGIAICAGILNTIGEYRFLCDADLSTPITDLDDFLNKQLESYDIIIGSREKKESKRIGEPFYRHLIGRVANFLIRILTLPQYSDTQCGFKLFKGEVAEELFSIQKLKSIGFDVEILFLADKLGYTVYELPVTWYYDADTRIRLFQDSIMMFYEILKVRIGWFNGVYASKLE